MTERPKTPTLLQSDTKMAQNAVSLIRNLLTVFGGIMIGGSLFGAQITVELWEVLVGAAMSILGIVMSIFDKSVTVEKIQGTVRHIISVIGGILVGSGRMAADELATWTGAVLSFIPVLQGMLSRKKASQLHEGQIQSFMLKGSRDKQLK